MKIEKINIILLFCEGRTGHFGQASFINSLVPFFKKSSNINLTIVKTDVENSHKVTYSNINNEEVIVIPKPENRIILNTKNSFIQKVYAKQIVNIISPVLVNKKNILFWVNSIDFLNISEVLKDFFPESRLMYVHHAFSWKGLFNISEERFSKAWRDNECDLHPGAFEWTEYQKRMAFLSDQTITVTDHAKDFFINVLGLPENKATKIYNGKVNLLDTHYDKALLRSKYGFNSGEKIIIYSGRITQDKGVDALIKAFNLALTSRNDLRLIIVGAGDIAQFASFASPNWAKVTYTGEVNEEHVRALYKLADIGVLPSLHEQCSFTSIEMRFHKLPIIVSDVDGLEEMFEDNVDALKLKVTYCENGFRRIDYKELSQKIVTLLENPELCNNLVENAYKKAEAEFSLEKMQKKYLEVICSMFC